MNKNWRLIRIANEKILDIPPQVSDYLAVESVLRSCAAGMSAKTISKVEDLAVDIIKKILREFYNTYWLQDLDINTLLIFGRVKGNYKNFSREIREISPILSDYDIIKAFYICSTYIRIKKEIDKHYD